MPYICYQDKKFRSDKLELIEKIYEIIQTYSDAGYSLTLRQLYYQLVARGIIENSERSYKNTGSLINDARLAGYINWYAIEDRTRYLRSLSHWENPASLIKSASEQYKRNLWLDQDYYVEVWVEKEALADVVGQACRPLDVPYFCCRGYVSQTEMWNASQRFIDKAVDGKYVVLIYLGDHDPSGIDMTRDIEERLQLFGSVNYSFVNNFLGVERIALNMDQVTLYSPPPNPAKVTDSRSGGYISKYGNSSWELDALEPQIIRELITSKVTEYADLGHMKKVRDSVDKEKQVMKRISEDWDNLYNRYTY